MSAQPAPPTLASNGRGRVRCVTFNVLSPENRDWDRRRTVIRDALHRLRADVVVLQEIRPGDVWDLIGSDLPWCATLIVEVEAPVGRLVVAHHKPSWPFPLEVEREVQAYRAALAVERHAGEGPAVVLGDFDATPDAASVLFWRGRRSLNGVSVCYQNAWETVRPAEPGLTFSAENPLVVAGEVATAVSRRIDYVLVRAGRHGALLQVLRCDRFLDEPVDGVWASDHYGVVADLAIPPHAPGTWGALPPSP